MIFWSEEELDDYMHHCIIEESMRVQGEKGEKGKDIAEGGRKYISFF